MSDVARTSVLVVDDEPVLAGTVKNYLERAGMAADTSSSSTSAFRASTEWRSVARCAPSATATS